MVTVLRAEPPLAANANVKMRAIEADMRYYVQTAFVLFFINDNNFHFYTSRLKIFLTSAISHDCLTSTNKVFVFGLKSNATLSLAWIVICPDIAVTRGTLAESRTVKAVNASCWHSCRASCGRGQNKLQVSSSALTTIFFALHKPHCRQNQWQSLQCKILVP